MLSFALARIRSYGTHFIGVVVCVALAGAFLSGVIAATIVVRAALTEPAQKPLAAADLVVMRKGEASPQSNWYERIANTAGVAAAATIRSPYGVVTTGEGDLSAQAITLPDDPQLRWFQLFDGRWPYAPSEIVAPRDAGLPIGSNISFRPDGSSQSIRMTVVGIGRATDPANQTTVRLYVPARAIDPTIEVRYVLVRVDPGTPPETVAARLRTSLGDALQVLPADLARSQASSSALGAFGDTQLVIIGLATTAVFVAVMIILSTFQALTARRRQLDARLRLLGARRAQLRTMILFEGVILGGGAGLMGGVVGTGLTAVVLVLLGYGDFILRPTLLAPVLVATIVMLVATVAACAGPARQTSRLDPAQAVRASSSSATEQPRTRRVITSVTMMAVGLAATAIALLAEPLVGVVAIIVLIAAALIGGADMTIAIASFIACKLGQHTHSAWLAATALRRQPGRARSIIAMVILVSTLVAGLLTGARTARETTDASLNRRFPVDISLTTTNRDISSLASALQQLPGIAETHGIPGTAATLAATSDRTQLSIAVVAVDDSLASVVNEPLPELDDGTALVSSGLARGRNLRAGDQITIMVNQTPHELTVKISPLADANNTGTLVVSPPALARLTATPPRVVSVWAKADPTADIGQLSTTVTTFARQTDTRLGGSLNDRATADGAINVLTTLSLGVLLASMIVAIVGTANIAQLTLTERTRSIAILRSLGARRRDIRRSFTWEIALTVALAAILGTTLGAILALAAASIAFASQGPLAIDVPTPILAVLTVALIVAATTAGWVAARAATRTQPAQTLAFE